MRTNTRVLPLAGALTLVVGALTGCAASMTTEQACDYLETEITAYTATVQDDLAEVSTDSDLTEAVELRKTMLEKYESIGNGVNNAEVRASFLSLTTAMKEVFPLLDEMVDDPASVPSEDFDAVTERISDAGMEFSEVCPGGNSDLLG